MVVAGNHAQSLLWRIVTVPPPGFQRMPWFSAPMAATTSRSRSVTKVIAVPSPKVTARYDRVQSYKDLPDILVKQISHFFERYKDLEEGKWVKVDGFGDDTAAYRRAMRADERNRNG